jgi:ankyrin repeat protein
MPTRVKDQTCGSNTLHVASIAGHTSLCQWLIEDDERRKLALKIKRQDYLKHLKEENEKKASSTLSSSYSFGSHHHHHHHHIQQQQQQSVPNLDVESEFGYLPIVKNDYRETSIVLAAENGRLDTLKVLVNYQDPHESSGYYDMSYSFHDDDDAKKGDMFSTLMSHNYRNKKMKKKDYMYELRRRNHIGFPPFHYACSRGQLEVCKWLIVNGGVNFDVNQMLLSNNEVCSACAYRCYMCM